MNPTMSRDEFCTLLEDCIEQRRRAEYARLRKCAQLSRQIAIILDAHPRRSYREVAASLGPEQGSYLLLLIDELEMWSRETHPVEVQP